MEHFYIDGTDRQRVTFRVLSIPAMALATCIILAITFGMVGALGQVIMHDDEYQGQLTLQSQLVIYAIRK